MLTFVNGTLFSLIGVLALVGNSKAASAPITAELQIRAKTIKVAVAHTPHQILSGLMFLTFLPKDHGMVFVYPHERVWCMWMRNTQLPLSVAFLDGRGQVIQFENMEPMTVNLHCPRSPARYAIEMNRGWFDTNGIKEGDIVQGLGQLPAWKEN
jgi:uncharacterized protein